MTRANSFLFVAILLLSIGCDQATKEVARDVLADQPTISLAADFVRFDLVRNPGGFLSLGVGLPEAVRTFFFVAAVPILLLTLCIVMIRAGLHSLSEWVGLALVAGGGLGNWLDRLYQNGAVTDFVSLGVGSLRTGIFNVADVVIVVGSGLLLVSAFRPIEEAVEADLAESAADD